MTSDNNDSDEWGLSRRNYVKGLGMAGLAAAGGSVASGGAAGVIPDTDIVSVGAGSYTTSVPDTSNLTFEDGEVVDYAAAQNEDVIREVVETDEGARRLGELGIGMNRGIDRVTDSILFDEKMGGTVHLALGRAYTSNFPEDRTDEANESAVHVDLITDLRTGGRLDVDGETVQKDGVFRWEDGFDG